MDSKFILFKQDISNYDIPATFTFPFYYTPNPLAIEASKQLQEYLVNQNDFEHNFGFGLNLDSSKLPIGKMFGVLVVKNSQGKLGFLASFSGKLANSNTHKLFVPPVYDLLKKESFFLKEELILNTMNAKIVELENSVEVFESRTELIKIKEQAYQEITELKTVIKSAKQIRKNKRENGLKHFAEKELNELIENLSKESISYKIKLKYLEKQWSLKISEAEKAYNSFLDEIDQLKKDRKKRSVLLQNKIFKEYTFLNADNESESLFGIFNSFNKIPPAGAGECAAPKLLHYAYLNGFTPIAMAEFWWGDSPKSELKKHKYYYPSCKGKCEPILTHMLKGLDVDANPLLENKAKNLVIQKIYEDDSIIVINKPAELLSVPGITIKDSVYTRILKEYPLLDSPVIIHRLDMSTSGLLVLAKTKFAHKNIQAQFIKRTVKKRYIALLNGVIEGEKGEINLPLRLDIEDRPKQLVCYEYGKKGHTLWKKKSVEGLKTRVYFYPLTGRTHQLRVHASHKDGLNSPIVGDDLYGMKDDRLCLHAEKISFIHPESNKRITFQVNPEF